MRIFKARDKELVLNHTYIMGILNVTPDSFSDGGKFLQKDLAMAHAKKMIKDGADIIDIGGQSTRPNHTKISPNEEWERIKDVVAGLSKLNTIISVDTFYPEVAVKALEAGAHVINDVTGFGDEMMQAVKASECGCVAMYNKGDNGTGILTSTKDFFTETLKKAEKLRIDISRICLDPGIGFGKSYEENLELIANTDMLKKTDCAYLMAASKKRVIGKGSGEVAESERGAGTLAAHSISQFLGADILRVHDVREAKMAASLTDELRKRRYKHE